MVKWTSKIPVQRNYLNITFKFSIWISLSTKFYLKQTVLIFWTKFAQKGYFWSETGPMNIINQFSIFELAWATSFISNTQFWVFEPNCPKRVFLVQSRKNEQHHRIQHIWISLGSKSYLSSSKRKFEGYFRIQHIQTDQSTKIHIK